MQKRGVRPSCEPGPYITADEDPFDIELSARDILTFLHGGPAGWRRKAIVNVCQKQNSSCTTSGPFCTASESGQGGCDRALAALLAAALTRFIGWGCAKGSTRPTNGGDSASAGAQQPSNVAPLRAVLHLSNSRAKVDRALCPPSHVLGVLGVLVCCAAVQLCASRRRVQSQLLALPPPRAALRHKSALRPLQASLLSLSLPSASVSISRVDS